MRTKTVYGHSDSFVMMAFIVAFSLYLPKFSIWSIGLGQIRMEDFIAGISFLLLILSFLYSNTIHYYESLKNIMFPIVGITIISFLSLFINSLYQETSIGWIFNNVRLLEYSVFLFWGFVLGRKSLPIVLVYIILTACAVFWQKWSGVTRPTGYTSGPWEAALLFNFGFILLKFSETNKILKVLIGILLIAGIVIVESRIGLFASIIIIPILLKNKIKHVFDRYLVFVFLFAGLIIIGISMIEKSERGKGILQLEKNIAFIGSAYNKLDIDNYTMNEPNVSPYGQSVDYSASVRVLKWVYVLKRALANPILILTGSSPGFYGKAVDGSFLRVFGELGIFGLLLYFVLFYNIFVISKETRLLILVLLINGIFIDVFYSSRSMTVILLLAGTFAKIKKDLFKGRYFYYLPN